MAEIELSVHSTSLNVNTEAYSQDLDAADAMPSGTVVVKKLKLKHKGKYTDQVEVVPGEEIFWAPKAGFGRDVLVVVVFPSGQSAGADGARFYHGVDGVSVTARDEKTEGTYYYAISVYDGKEVVSLDPIIIIKRQQ